MRCWLCVADFFYSQYDTKDNYFDMLCKSSCEFKYENLWTWFIWWISLNVWASFRSKTFWMYEFRCDCLSACHSKRAIYFQLIHTLLQYDKINRTYTCDISFLHDRKPSEFYSVRFNLVQYLLMASSTFHITNLILIYFYD